MFFNRDPLRNLYVRSESAHDIEPEEIFSDAGVSLPEDIEEVYERQKKFEVPTSSRVPFVVGVISSSMFFCLLGYVVYMNTAQGKTWQVLAQKNTQRIATLAASRGDILDRNGKLLASSVSAFDSEVRMPAFLEGGGSIEELAHAAAQDDRDQSGLLKLLNEAKTRHLDRITLERNVSLKNISALEEKLRGFSGITFREHPMRTYSYGESLAHILGYTGRGDAQDMGTGRYAANEEFGKQGLELTYDDILRGEAGRSLTLVDAWGRTLGERVIKEGKKGSDLFTTLDADLQQIGFSVLSGGLRDRGLTRGVFIALDPRDGALRALVSIPSFNPAQFVSGIDAQDYQKLAGDPANPLFNRALSGEYPSGSTIKPFLALAALHEHVISANKVLLTNGFISVPSVYDPSVIYTFRDWKNHGAVDMRKAIAVSSNAYFYMIGGGYKDQQGLGVDRIEKYLSLFGWGKRTGIDLPGEATGFVPTPQWKKAEKHESWYIGDTYHMSIGQGDVLVTPLQLAAGIAAIANGGTKITPHVLSSAGNHRASYGQDALPFSAQELNVVREGMRMAVTEGSSKLLQTLPVEVAGKTGTAQVEVSSGTSNALFVGFAPYRNPELVFLVLLEKGGESMEAVKITKEILIQYFSLHENASA